VDVNPINYQLVFEPDLKKFTFEGKETITVDCKKPTKKIVINCSELKIKSSQVKYKGKIIASKVKINEKNEELQITLNEKIKAPPGHSHMKPA
jgi:aminopeptidase N